MTDKSPRIASGKLDRLLALVENTHEISAPAHLTDEELAGYTVGTLSAAELARADAHLASCAECSREIEFLRGESAVWRTPEGKARLRQKDESLLALARDLSIRPGTELWPSFELAVAAETGEEVRGETDIYGDILRYVTKEEGGNLSVTLASHALALEGRKVLLTAPGFAREITLNRVRPDQVGAEITIERREREDLLPGSLIVLPLASG
jgi:Putative zinc-finger